MELYLDPPKILYSIEGGRTIYFGMKQNETGDSIMRRILFFTLVALTLSGTCLGDVFGNTNNHSTNSSAGAGGANCGKVTSPASSGTITSIGVYLGASVVNIGAAIYADSGGTTPTGAPLATQSAATTTDGSIGLETIAISYAFAPSTVYWLCFQPNGNINYYYDSVGDNQNDSKNGTYPTWPNPWGSSTFSLNRQIEIFATFTPTSTAGGIIGGGGGGIIGQ
jgi:hypothetical protein